MIRKRMIVGFALIMVVFLFGLRQIKEEKSYADHYFGVTFADAPSVPILDSVDSDSPASKAGLKPGDRLLSLNSEALNSFDDLDAIEYQKGESVPAVILRDGKPIEMVIVPGKSLPWAPLVILLLSLLAHLGIALLALTRFWRDQRARLLFFLAAAISVELALPVRYHSFGLEILYLLLNGIQLGLELHLASSIPHLQSWVLRRPWVIRLYYGLGLGFSGAVILSILFESTSTPFLWSPAAANFVFESIGHSLWALAVPALLAYQAFNWPEAEGRRQAAMVMLGGLPWSILTLVGLLYPSVYQSSWINALSPAVLLPYPIAIAIAIFRYHLLDLHQVLRRSLIFTAISLALVFSFYGFLIAGMIALSEKLSGVPNLWLVAMASLLIGLLFYPLKNSIQKTIDHRFFPERYAVRQRLIGLAGELPALGNLPSMGRYLVDKLESIFHTKSTTIFLADPKSGVLVTLATSAFDIERDLDRSFLLSPDDPGVRFLRRWQRPLQAHNHEALGAILKHRLRELEARLLVPLVNQNRLIGLLVLGRKQDGSPFSPEEEELLQLLSHHVATVFENARLFESATYESLTGTLRREGILQELDHEFQRALRYGRPLTLAMADLDHFKKVNDEHGHLVGDTVLQRTGQAIRNNIRTADRVGRYGGEEFLIVLPETELEGARTVAEKIRRAIKKIKVDSSKGPVNLSISLGLASINDLAETTSAESLIRAADEAMYLAKRGGRDRVCSWHQDMDS